MICARGGSKGLPRKNVLPFAGKPLIQWSIDAARQSQYIDDIVVSTDDIEIRDIALAAEARVPFIRPADLADDSSDINHAIAHAIEWLRDNENQQYDFVILLQPTQPLRDANLVDQFIQYYFEHASIKQDALVTVVKAEPKVALVMKTEGEYIRFAIPRESTPSNRQEMPAYYLPAGSMFVAPVGAFLKNLSFYTAHTRFFEVDAVTAMDIDSKQDLIKAEELYYKKVNRQDSAPA